MINIMMAIFQILIALGLIGFWISFYFTEYKNRKMSEVEFKHELSFPLPDLGWVSSTLFIASIGLIMDQKFGYFFSAIAGSGMIFLGLIDLAFDIQNDKFNTKEHGFDAYFSIFIVLLCLIMGPIFIIYGAFGLEVF